jgi:hypothetical protein
VSLNISHLIIRSRVSQSFKTHSLIMPAYNIDFITQCVRGIPCFIFTVLEHTAKSRKLYKSSRNVELLNMDVYPSCYV